MFVITFDTDWASQPVINDVLNLLNDFSLNCTFFITNKIDFSNFRSHELAIHPNFDRLNNQEEILEKTLSLLPIKKAKGSRSHKLFHNMPLMALYKKFGLEYDSNYFLPNSLSPEPFLFEQSGVLEIPFFFADDTYAFLNSNYELNKINLTNNGVKVFLFHPIHIFLNTRDTQYYQKIKNNISNSTNIKKFVNSEKEGIRSLFIEVLKYIDKNSIEIKTMDEVNHYWRKNNLKI